MFHQLLKNLEFLKNRTFHLYEKYQMYHLHLKYPLYRLNLKNLKMHLKHFDLLYLLNH